MRGTRWLFPLVSLLVWPVASQAAPAPIVFDFEDGLQGWTLGGSAQRVQTQVLGGEWAIFLDGFLGAGMFFIPEDLQTIGSVTFDQLIIDGSGSASASQGVCLINNTFVDCVSIGFLQLVIGMEPALAFIDNITFHPVPEPSSLVLLAFSLGAILIARQRVG